MLVFYRVILSYTSNRFFFFFRRLTQSNQIVIYRIPILRLLEKTYDEPKTSHEFATLLTATKHEKNVRVIPTYRVTLPEVTSKHIRRTLLSRASVNRERSWKNRVTSAAKNRRIMAATATTKTTFVVDSGIKISRPWSRLRHFTRTTPNAVNVSRLSATIRRRVFKIYNWP